MGSSQELSKIVSNNQTILEIVNTTFDYIHEHKKAIVFAVDINHAELLTKAYKHEGFSAKALHSKMTTEEIATEIELFKNGETKILVSVLMLTTGFDVPDTDVAVIARPTKSQNLYKQMVGRVLRLAKDKTHSILLDCGNVIENLGMPLDSIKEKAVEETESKNKCKKCKSENLSLQKKDGKTRWVCKDCGFHRDVEDGVYECKICKKTYTHDAKFDIKNEKLYLVCDDCPYPTLISEFTGDEKFVEVYTNHSQNTFKPKKSLGAIFEERKEKEKKEESINKRMLKEFEIKIAKKFENSYLSTNKDNREDLVELRNYVQSELLKDKYSRMKLNLINKNEGYFNTSFIVNISNTEEFFRKLVSAFHSKFLNNLYEKRIISYFHDVLTEALQNKSRDFILNFRIPKKEYGKIIEIENDFFQELEKEEKCLINKIDTITVPFDADSGSYKTNIYFERD